MFEQSATTDEVAYLFVDFSNFSHGIRDEAARRGDPVWAVRAHAANLRRVLAGGRLVKDAVLVANRAIPDSALDHFRSGFRAELVEAGCITGTEQAGDEVLQNAIYRTILQAAPPATIVLATADGAGWGEGRGFCVALHAAHQRGFVVEVASFSTGVSGRLRDLAVKSGAFVALEPFYETITFLEGRWAVVRRVPPTVSSRSRLGLDPAYVTERS